MNHIKLLKYITLIIINIIISLSVSAQAGNEHEAKEESVNEKELSRKFKRSKKRLYSPNNKDITPSKVKILDSLATEIRLKAPGTFTYYITAYKTSTNKTEALDKLEMAYGLEPQNTEVLKEFVNYAELNNQVNLKNEFAQKLASNNAYSAAVLDYNKNVLNSVPNNTIVITNGDVDTYPVWIQQEIHAINPAVHIWNIENLQDKKYQNQVFKTTGIPIFSGTKTSREILNHILTNKPYGEVYLTLTLPHDILRKYSANLYLTGLALNYNTSTINNNLNLLQHNWETKFDISHYLDDHLINKNYLLPMIQLYKHYDLNGEKDRASELKKAIKKLAKAQNISNPLSN